MTRAQNPLLLFPFTSNLTFVATQRYNFNNTKTTHVNSHIGPQVYFLYHVIGANLHFLNLNSRALKMKNTKIKHLNPTHVIVHVSKAQIDGKGPAVSSGSPRQRRASLEPWLRVLRKPFCYCTYSC